MSVAVLFVIVGPLLAAAVALVVGHRTDRVCALVCVGASAAAFAAALVVGWQHWGAAAPAVLVGGAVTPSSPLPITVAVTLDPLSASMLVLVTAVAVLVQLYSVSYLRGDPRYPSYAALVALFTAAMALVVAADDLIVLLVGWEVMGACSYFLIGHHWELAEARSGAVKAYVMTHVGDVVMLFGFFVLAHAAGTFRISALVGDAGRIDGRTATLGTLLVLAGVVGKSAQFPLHSWLPDAMPGPTPISALIHAATMVAAGVYLVARLGPVFALSPVTLTVLAVLACVTMLGGALFALAADDLKRVLAWSTVSQLAYMFGALAVGSTGPAVLHLLSHGVFKALLFLAAGSVIHAVGTQRLDGMGGLRVSMPVTFATMTIGFASLAGVPPFVGFFSKDALLGAVGASAAGTNGGRAWLVLVTGLAVAGLTGAYSVRAWLMIFFGPHAAATTGATASIATAASEVAPRESPALMVGPLVALAVAAVVGGAAVWWPGFLGGIHDHVSWPVLVGSLVLAGCGGGFAWAEWLRLGKRDPAATLGRFRPALARELGFDTLLAVGMVRPTYGGSRWTAVAEDLVVTPYARGVEAAAGWGGRLVRWLHDGNTQRYATVVVVGAVAVAVIAGLVQP